MPYENFLRWIREIPGHPRTQGLCEKVIKEDRWQLYTDPYQYKTQEMCEWAIEKNPWCLNYVPDQYETQEMCEKVFQEYSRQQYAVTDRFKASVKKLLKKDLGASKMSLLTSRH